MNSMINSMRTHVLRNLPAFFASLLLLAAILSMGPLLGYAAGTDTSQPPSGGIVPQCASSQGECGWTDLLELVNRFITFLLYLSATLATLSFAYAGWLYMTSGGDSGKISQAHGIFIKVLLGFLFAFGGWLIVQLILSNVGLNSGYSIIK